MWYAYCNEVWRLRDSIHPTPSILYPSADDLGVLNQQTVPNDTKKSSHNILMGWDKDAHEWMAQIGRLIDALSHICGYFHVTNFGGDMGLCLYDAYNT